MQEICRLRGSGTGKLADRITGVTTRMQALAEVLEFLRLPLEATNGIDGGRS